MGEATTKRIDCPCGARLRVPDDGGRHKLRCPKCRRIMISDGASHSHTARRPEHPPRPHPSSDASKQRHHAEGPAPTDHIRVRCACGKKIGVPPTAAGKRAKCPKCGAVVPIPVIELDDGPGDDILALEPNAHDRPLSLVSEANVGIFKFKDEPPPPAAPPATQPSASVSAASPSDSFASPLPPEPVDSGPRVCPCCQQSLPPNAIICTDCGINLRTGRSLITTQDENLNEIYTYARAVFWWVTLPLAIIIISFGVYPLGSEAFGLRKPWVVRGIAVLTIVCTLAFWDAVARNPDLESLYLWNGVSHELSDTERKDLTDHGWTTAEIDQLATEYQGRPFEPYQLLTHAFLHASVMHLALNMLFLVVLGSRVNALIGNLLTILLYPALAVISGLAQLVTHTEFPMALLGASGAIMGLAGMYLVLFPVHKVHMGAWFRFLLYFRFALFPIRGFWVVLFYIGFDVLYTALGVDSGVAHWAHLGGFIAGVVFALLLLVTRLVNARGGDILSITLGRHAWPLVGPPNRRGLTLW